MAYPIKKDSTFIRIGIFIINSITTRIVRVIIRLYLTIFPDIAILIFLINFFKKFFIYYILSYIIINIGDISIPVLNQLIVISKIGNFANIAISRIIIISIIIVFIYDSEVIIDIRIFLYSLIYFFIIFLFRIGFKGFFYHMV